MKVIVGDTRSKKNLARLIEHGWGRMYISRRPQPFECEPWGFDNGAFIAWRNGLTFDEPAFQRRLDIAHQVGRPYIAITPDIVAAGQQSLDYSCRWIEKLPNDWPWYLSLQDGMSRDDIENVMSLGWSGLFLGGTDKFKRETAWKWCEFAHEHGLPFHYGRAGTLKKLEHAKHIEADSVDSAFPLWTDKRFTAFIAQYHDQSQLRL